MGIRQSMFSRKSQRFFLQTQIEKRGSPAAAGKLHADWATSEKQRSRRRGRGAITAISGFAPDGKGNNGVTFADYRNRNLPESHQV